MYTVCLENFEFDILWRSFHSRWIQLFVIVIARHVVLQITLYVLEMLDIIQFQSIFCQLWCYQSFLIEEVIQDWVGSNCDIWTRFELIFVRVWWATKTTSSFSFAFITSSALNLVERNIWHNVISKSKWKTIYILNLRGTIYQ